MPYARLPAHACWPVSQTRSCRPQLKIRVAQLEEALENDTDAASDLGRPIRARGSEAGVDASEAPAALSMTVTEESLAQVRQESSPQWL